MNSTPSAAPVTVLGAGQLGSAVVGAFIQRGHPVTVWNRTSARTAGLVADGARPASDVSAAVGASPVVIVVVSDYAAVQDVLRAAGDALAGLVVVNLASGTPALAREMAGWVADRGAEYLDAAAMSGTRLVGNRDALFLFSGSAQTFTTYEDTLGALGQAVHLGRDPGLTSLYDTALFGLAWTTLAGFYHAVGLIGTEGVSPSGFAAVAAGHLPFLGALMTEHAEQISAGKYPYDDGTVSMHAAAIDHLVETSRQHGVATDVPEFLEGLLGRAVAEGYGDIGIASVAELIRGPLVR